MVALLDATQEGVVALRRPRLVCSWCFPGDHSSDASHGCCAAHYAAMMQDMGVPESEWRVVVRRHPRGGWTLAVRSEQSAARTYEGWFATAAAAGRAML